jgi:hypothetical protein
MCIVVIQFCLPSALGGRMFCFTIIYTNDCRWSGGKKEKSSMQDSNSTYSIILTGVLCCTRLCSSSLHICGMEQAYDGGGAERGVGDDPIRSYPIHHASSLLNELCLSSSLITTSPPPLQSPSSTSSSTLPFENSCPYPFPFWIVVSPPFCLCSTL